MFQPHHQGRTPDVLHPENPAERQAQAERVMNRELKRNAARIERRKAELFSAFAGARATDNRTTKGKPPEG